MSRTKIILLAVAVPVVLILGLFIEFYLPSSEIVRVTGMEVKRMDRTGSSSSDQTGGMSTRDMRLIYTQIVSDNSVKAFRNEDTGWGFPFYFKFDEADIAAKAAAMEKESPRPTVRVTYYGWRINMLDMFPNVIDLKRVDPEDTYIPVTKILFLTALVVLILVIYLQYRKITKRRQARRGGV